MVSDKFPITPNTPKGMQQATGMPIYELQDPHLADEAYASYVRERYLQILPKIPYVANKAYIDLADAVQTEHQKFLDEQIKLNDQLALDIQNIAIRRAEIIEKERPSIVKNANHDFKDKLGGGAIILGGVTVLATGGIAAIPLVLGMAAVPGTILAYGTSQSPVDDFDKKMEAEEKSEQDKARLAIDTMQKDLAKKYEMTRKDIQSKLTLVRGEVSAIRQTERLFGMSEALVTCAEQTGASVLQIQKDGGELLERLCSSQHTLADLNNYIQQTTAGTIDAILRPDAFEGRTPEILAQQAFVSHVIIPHLDYFLMQGLENTKDPAEHNIEQYDALQKIVSRAGMQVNLATGIRDTAPDTLIKDAKAEAIPTVDLAFVRDPTAGTIPEKLQRASQLVDDEIDKHTEHYKKLEGLIADYVRQVQSKQDEQRASTKEMSKAAAYNSHIDEKIEKERIKGNTAKKEYKIQQITRFLTSCASITIGVATIEPNSLHAGIAGIVNAMGEGHIISGSLGGGRIIGDMFAGSANKDGRQQFIDILEGKKIDEAKLDAKLKAIQDEMTRLQQQHKESAVQASTVKAEAITGLFVMKSLLDHGQFVTEGLEERWKSNPNTETINFAEFFRDLGTGSRIKEAVEHLCFGYADSNDLAVILATSNTMQGKLTDAQKIVHAFVEEEVKPNIADYCQHASQVDFIYQANLTGIGTPFHQHRKSIRAEHDRATEVLIQDAFGVTTDMVASNIVGARDVRNVFGLYLTRHGSASHITDEGIQDGMYGKIRQKKSVQPIPSDTMDEYVEMAKAAGGIRAKAPDISNVFTRICGYEYYYPIAPNSEGVRNIIEQNADAPATYMMVNKVIHNFIKKLSFASIDHYQGNVKEGSPVDNLLAQSFMDFFQELGKQHAADPDITQRRADFATDQKAAVAYSARLDRYAKFLTDKATDRFDLFKDIYERNLSKVLEVSTSEKREILEQQLAALETINPELNPKNIIRPDTHEARLRAETANHTFGNMNAMLGAR